ncbi:TRAP transporter substrate-binding protein DctP [Comamonas testosteroni]|uniref:TRAP transporter substrate-binding protein DctP n=1 Tax=Comamonas testosteroni TaxID=285 RepID=UPI0028F0DEB0|nr:TRAP transporter substrate-binding protein DctP [Comamonas testosteroni]
MIQRRQLLQAGACTAVIGMPALAQTKYRAEYRLSLVVGAGTNWHFAAERFANLVREKTQGRLNFKLYPGSSLVQGQQDRELTALRQGVIDILVGTTVNWSGTVKDFALFNLPGLMPNDRAVDAVLASDALNKDFYEVIRRSGMEPLASGEYGPIQLINAKRRVAVPNDIKGLKIRVVATPMQQQIMSAMHANPTTMTFADAQPALASGAIDGLTLTLEQFVAYKLSSLGQKHIAYWNQSNELIHFLVANPVWKTWSDQDQKLVREAAQEAGKELTRRVRETVATNEQMVAKQGVDIYKPTAQEQALWNGATREVYQRWKQQINAPLVSKFEQVVAQTMQS